MGYNDVSDEGLPEVVADPSPQALTNIEEQQRYHQEDHHDKYHVVYDETPKLPDDVPYPHETPETLARSPVGSVPWETLAAGDGDAGAKANSETAMEEPRICGLRRKVFFLLLLGALVVVAAAIGGGIGGGVAAARSREGTGSAASSSASTSSTTSLPSSETNTPSTSTPASSTTTTEPSPTPTFLNNQTGPLGFGFQGFTGVNYTGNVTKIYRDEGFFDFGVDIWSYVWLPNGTSCCVTFCEDQHNATGYRCQPRKRDKASDGFPRIYIWCDTHLAGVANTTCS